MSQVCDIRLCIIDTMHKLLTGPVDMHFAVLNCIFLHLNLHSSNILANSFWLEFCDQFSDLANWCQVNARPHQVGQMVATANGMYFKKYIHLIYPSIGLVETPPLCSFFTPSS